MLFMGSLHSQFDHARLIHTQNAAFLILMTYFLGVFLALFTKNFLFIGLTLTLFLSFVSILIIVSTLTVIFYTRVCLREIETGIHISK